MNTSQKGFVEIMITVLVVVVLAGVGGYFYLQSQKSASPSTSTTYDDTITPTRIPGDINRDGKKDVLDQQLFKVSLGCKNTDACWNKVIGKTSDGDNPIYEYEFDYNGDGVISEADMNSGT